MKYENIDSTILLTRVKELIAERGYRVINLDSIIVLQKPKVKPYIEAMRKRVAEILEIDIEQVSVKATTEENLDLLEMNLE